ncbi:MAG TPA: hypothetical protein VEZ90_03755 [Blastocatellia bacterium]|nr:hypothetical protein [Blastocatellia bacterium]
MMKCRNARKLIDEANNVEILPFEANAHIDSCVDCRRRVDERQALSALLTSTGRISAPANFDAVLRFKLNERLARRWAPFGIRSSLYLRFGTATAVVVCLVVGGDLALKYRNSGARPPKVAIGEGPGSSAGTPRPVTEATPTIQQKANDRSGTGLSSKDRTTRLIANAGTLRSFSHPRRGTYFPSLNRMDPTTEAAALFLLQGSGSERRLAIPYVIVGGQQPVVNVSSNVQPGQDVRVAF